MLSLTRSLKDFGLFIDNVSTRSGFHVAPETIAYCTLRVTVFACTVVVVVVAVTVDSVACFLWRSNRVRVS